MLISITAAITAAITAVALTGCADSIRPDRPDAGIAADAAGDTGGSGSAALTCTAGNVCTAPGSDGSYTTVVDATSETAWIYVDLETGARVADTDPWDLRFQRVHISANGGVSGAGGVEVAEVAATAFAQVTDAPADGYITDAADSNANGIPEYAFDQRGTWYDYNVTTHVLTPRPVVYVIKTDGGSTIKLEIKKYYDEAGTSGWFTFHWGPL
jgi:hypothetical protein